MTTFACLHGFMGAPSDWDELKTAMASHRFVTPNITPAACWRQGVERLRDELPARSILVGYSLGARLALACALASAGKFLGLVFVSGSPGLPKTQRQRRLIRDLQTARRLETEPRQQFLSQWYRQAVFASLSPAEVQEQISRKLDADGRQWADVLRAFSVGRQPNYWRRLPELKLPVLVVAGELDRKYVAIARRMAKRCCDGQCEIVARAGHVVHREQPEAFVHLLRSFTESVNSEDVGHE